MVYPTPWPQFSRETGTGASQPIPLPVRGDTRNAGGGTKGGSKSKRDARLREGDGCL